MSSVPSSLFLPPSLPPYLPSFPFFPSFLFYSSTHDLTPPTTLPPRHQRLLMASDDVGWMPPRILLWSKLALPRASVVKRGRGGEKRREKRYSRARRGLTEKSFVRVRRCAPPHAHGVRTNSAATAASATKSSTMTPSLSVPATRSTSSGAVVAIPPQSAESRGKFREKGER